MMYNTPKIKISLQKKNPTLETKQQMWALYQQSYQTSEVDFYTEMEQFDLYAYFRQKGQIIGFVGIQLNRPEIHGKEFLLVRFGQALIQERHRGQFLIPKTALKLSTLFWKEIIAGKVHFWGNALTYKSYLVVAKSVDTFYPTYRQSTPYQVKEIMDFIGSQQYKRNYEKHSGIVKCDACVVDDISGRLCFKYKEDPDIRFFTKANPGYENGNGLVIITPMNIKNLWSLIKKYCQQYSSKKPQLKLPIIKLNNFHLFPC